MTKSYMWQKMQNWENVHYGALYKVCQRKNYRRESLCCSMGSTDARLGQNSRFWKRDKIADFDYETIYNNRDR